MSLMDCYDRDGRLIPVDWYDKSKHPGRQFKWGTQQRVGRTIVGDVTVSTVWLMGIDHGYGDGPPLLFETMIFGGECDQDLRRYATEEEALRGHLAAVDALRAGNAPFGGDDA